jgi:hypothetical protein
MRSQSHLSHMCEMRSQSHLSSICDLNRTEAQHQTEHENFHPKEIVEIHGGTLQFNNRAIAAKVMAMECLFQNPECRGDACQNE